MRKVLALIVLLLCLTSLSANISPDGLISKVNFSGIKYLDPYQTAEDKAA